MRRAIENIVLFIFVCTLHQKYTVPTSSLNKRCKNLCLSKRVYICGAIQHFFRIYFPHKNGKITKITLRETFFGEIISCNNTKGWIQSIWSLSVIMCMLLNLFSRVWVVCNLMIWEMIRSCCRSQFWITRLGLWALNFQCYKIE